jgi:putative FmdB family regulatory protein
METIMPIYEFKCTRCEKEQEKIVPVDTIQISCPYCGGMASKKLSVPGGFQLKGTGWYKPSASTE